MLIKFNMRRKIPDTFDTYFNIVRDFVRYFAIFLVTGCFNERVFMKTSLRFAVGIALNVLLLSS